jgi:MtN3 and saliva related transmembrane protein
MLVGIFAGILTTGCWVPQVVKSLRSRKVEHFSWIYLVALTTGIGLWFTYGIIKGDAEIWLANGLSGLAVIVLLALKLHTSLHGITGEALEEPLPLTPLVEVEVAELPL